MTAVPLGSSIHLRAAVDIADLTSGFDTQALPPIDCIALEFAALTWAARPGQWKAASGSEPGFEELKAQRLQESRASPGTTDSQGSFGPDYNYIVFRFPSPFSRAPAASIKCPA